MQRKKNYLQRLLAIYIAFFVVLIFGFIFQVAPNFTRGVANGMEIGEEMNEAYAERTPRAIYYLWNIPIVQSKPIAIENNDTQVAIEGHLSTHSCLFRIICFKILVIAIFPSIIAPADKRTS